MILCNLPKLSAPFTDRTAFHRTSRDPTLSYFIIECPMSFFAIAKQF